MIAGLLLGAAGCTSGSGGSDGGEQTPAGDDACAALVGKSFLSVTEGECGLGPNGVVLCHWRLDFDEDEQGALTLMWMHSDVGESGTVTCDDGALTMNGGGSPSYSGTYDPDTETVIWDDLEYQLDES
ncbi:hypothetical protein [Chondromyces apiculatus]|uniref:Uncharacterized protein n=1 Tax=Chondromyces apiculatus DSM 436 TaxID=1192034 RepID=A0A017STR3_9BACT|nr:hypothetical protein [Chondromyces apiculatus]EYF00147.1 Hypothetical protein CAP_1134 [Chondromyces apiculatus DSM 436]